MYDSIFCRKTQGRAARGEWTARPYRGGRGEIKGKFQFVRSYLMRGMGGCLLSQTADNTHYHQQRSQRGQYQVQCHFQRLLSCQFLNLFTVYHGVPQM